MWPTYAGSSRSAAMSLGHDVALLAERIALHIESLVPRGRARCLDIGCGDMAVAAAVHARLSRTDWRYIDVLADELEEEARRNRHGVLDGCTMSRGEGEHDIALLCDVLHQLPEDAARLLGEAGRIARHVIVNDRFGSGVTGRYVTREGFVRLVAERRFHLTALDCCLDLYDQPAAARMELSMGRPFIAVLELR